METPPQTVAYGVVALRVPWLQATEADFVLFSAPGMIGVCISRISPEKQASGIHTCTHPYNTYTFCVCVQKDLFQGTGICDCGGWQGRLGTLVAL